jgi:hypothetical protein
MQGVLRPARDRISVVYQHQERQGTRGDDLVQLSLDDSRGSDRPCAAGAPGASALSTGAARSITPLVKQSRAEVRSPRPEGSESPTTVLAGPLKTPTLVGTTQSGPRTP